MSESTPRPCGVWAAAVTPLTGALEPDLPAFVRHCRWLLDRGCDGVVPIGTTGEGNCFSVSQRSGLIEAATASGLAMSRFIFGTGSCALADAVELTRRAVAAGAAGVLVLPP